MKNSIFNQKIVRTLLGVVLATNVMWNAGAQEMRQHLAKLDERHVKTSIGKITQPEEEKLLVEVLDLIEEVPTVSFINKQGEVVAILYGDKSVLKEMYKDDLSKSYFLSAYRNHEVYLIR